MNQLYLTTLSKYETIKEEYESLRKRYDDLIASHSSAVDKLELSQVLHSCLLNQNYDLIFIVFIYQLFKSLLLVK